MHESQMQQTKQERYLGSERPIGMDENKTGLAAKPAERTERSTFEHEPSIRVVLALFLVMALILAWQLVRLPLGSSGAGLSGLALLASGYLAFRLVLTRQSVVIDATGFELHTGKRVDRVAFDAIRNVRFDRMSHDLLVETAKTTYRVPRTLQGHRVIRQRLLAAAPQEPGDEAALLWVKPRLMPRVAGTLALCVMAMCVSAVMWVNTGLGVLNLMGLLLPSYALFDRCIRRSYRLDCDGIEIRGLWSPRFHARGELISAEFRKGALSSTLVLDFGTEKVELHEYLLGQSLVEISEFMERNWSARVNPAERRSGVTPGVTSELT